ncbi:uncharacterized protein TNCV_5072171 [Trichonephila clavipes]|nr:uncharacterized protein TNCV_5072171 [Trichonephila clavipes]
MIFLSRNKSSCAAEQVHSEAGLEAVDRRAPNNSETLKWTMEADVSVPIDTYSAWRRSAGERCLPECVIERHSGLTPGVMVWGAISYHGRSNLLRIEVSSSIVLDPIFSVEKTVTEFIHLDMLQIFLMPIIKEKMPGVYIFQQNGAHYHYHSNVISYFNAEVPVYIGRGGHQDHHWISVYEVL